MRSKDLSSIIWVTMIFFLIACGFVFFLFDQQEIVEGKLVNVSYTTEGEEEAFVNDSGVSGTVVELKDFFLVIEVNGKTATYKVDFETYIKAVDGQVIFKMWCNPFSCVVIE